MQFRHIVFTVTLLGTATLAAAAMANNSSAQDFVTKASIANKFEIDSSKVALEKAQRSDVKSIANMMVEDHTKTGEKLEETLEKSKSGAKPADKLDAKHQKLLKTLEATPADQFDTKYISIQTDAHKEVVALFTDYSTKGKDQALKDFANETLPTLKAHLKHVQDINRK